jgi:hypothetical protein
MVEQMRMAIKRLKTDPHYQKKEINESPLEECGAAQNAHGRILNSFNWFYGNSWPG